MDVSPNALRKETLGVLNEVNAQIAEIKRFSIERGIPPEKVRDERGNWPMVQLLLAKTQCLATLTALNEQTSRRPAHRPLRGQ